MMRLSWARLRRAWAIAGTTALVVFTTWSLLAFRANAEARAALEGGEDVAIAFVGGVWVFEPATGESNAGSLLFFPGGLVDPRAYAPLLRAIAANGHRAMLVPLPRRGAFGGAEDPAVLRLAHDRSAAVGGRWVVAGHSKGGKIAAMYAAAFPGDTAGLVLIGTSHPRDVDLASVRYPVVQVLAGRDRIAGIARVDRNRHNLPAHTSRIVIDGGNHSQFGDYGFQPGDRFARITRAEQRARTTATVLDALARATEAHNEEPGT